MVKVINKEFHVEIRKSFSRFISILLIVALGVAFYAGIRSTEPDMRQTGDKLYDESDLMDIKIISTMGLEDTDINKVKELSEVKEAVGSYSKDVIGTLNNSEQVLKFMSYTDSLNQVSVTKGRLPKNDTECMVDEAYFKSAKLKLGQSFKIASGNKNDKLSDSLKNDTYTIVGTFTSTLYFSTNRGNSSVGNGSVNGLAVVLPDAFCMSVYSEMYVTLKGTKEMNCYSDKYEKAVDKVKKKLEDDVSKVCIKARYDKLYKEATDAINKLEDARKQVQNGITEATKKKASLKSNITKLENASAALDGAMAEYQSKIQAYDNYINKYRAAGSVPAGVLSANAASIEQLEREKQAIVDAQAPTKEQKTKLEKQITKCKEGVKTAEDTVASLKEKDKELELNISDAYEARDEIQSPTWYVQDRTALTAYEEYDQDAQRINNIGKVFPVIFFLVAALVSLTTMTRMVYEQRTQIGTLKALGYEKKTIAGKYIKYAMLATVTGSVFGSIVGVYLFPNIIIRTYRTLYPRISSVSVSFNWIHTLTATVISIVCVLAATIYACYAVLSENPAELMRPQAPKTGKKILLERVPFIWKRLGFHAKSTIRNMVRYKKRFFMTLFGISGCMALILVGFGLKDSVNDIVNNQYGKIHHYDANVVIGSTVSDKRIKEAVDFFDHDERIANYLKLYQSSMTFEANGKEEDGYLVVPQDADKLSDYVSFRERVSGKKVSFGGDKVVIDEKLAKLLKVKEGDQITLAVTDGDTKKVTVGGITENYLYHYVYISPDLYQQIYGKKAGFNQIYLNVKAGTDTKQLSQEILSYKACSTAFFQSTLKDKMGTILSSIDVIVIVLVVSAGGLAFIVMYNLNNINISERKRELATLKVLGFYDNEVTGYIVRENVIISILGVALGCLLGLILHQFVIQTAELDMIMFGRKIHGLSFLYSALLTILFTIIINFTMHFKINKIDMAESMKSVE